MKSIFRITTIGLIFAMGISMVINHPTGNHSLYDCTSSSDCGIGECCVIGMMRYSTPQCLPTGQVEDFCRENAEPENRTLYYPNEISVDVYDVYTHVCPCDSGLQCIDNSCSQGDVYDNNYIY